MSWIQHSNEGQKCAVELIEYLSSKMITHLATNRGSIIAVHNQAMKGFYGISCFHPLRICGSQVSID